MPAAISMLGIKTLDEMHAWVSYKITKKLSTTAKWWKQREIHDLEMYQKFEKRKSTQTRN